MRWLLLILPFAPAWAIGFVPTTAATQPACIEVANNTDYWMPGSIRAPGTPPVGFRIDGNQSRYVCMSLDLPKGTPLEIMIKSGWGLPIGTCGLPVGVVGVRVQIERETNSRTQESVIRMLCG
jgi:hypothetical protein